MKLRSEKMKDIRIKRLILRNFKCHEKLELEFEGRNADIYGDNAVGKTTVYDALTWLLFGRDSRGNGEKSIDVKPLNADGEVKDHTSETVVEAVLTVSGEPIQLCRTLKEIWSTKRGRSEATFDGNTSDYFVNGVPCKRSVFADEVERIVDEDVFKLLTDVNYFAEKLSWQGRREVLFKLAGVVSDEEIMRSDERFLPLISSKGTLTVDEYKKKLVADKKRHSGASGEIPARISECQRTIDDIRGIDFAAIERDMTVKDAKRAGLEGELSRINNDSASEALRIALEKVKSDVDRLDADNDIFRARQSADMPDVSRLRSTYANLASSIARLRKTLGGVEEYENTLETRIDESRKRWMSVNAEEFNRGWCPACGQVLPAKKMEEAKARFDADKQARLADIEKTANILKASKHDALSRIDALQDEIRQVERELAAAKDALEAAEACKVEVRDVDGYAERRQQLVMRKSEIEEKMADLALSQRDVKDKLCRQIDEIGEELKGMREQLSRGALLEYSEKRIESLREDARNAAVYLDAIDRELYLLEEFTRYKVKFVEASVNDLFELVSFRLFREQANGGLEDRCDVTVNGIPYINLNSGMRINAGIDIINVISAAYGVTVPLFIDNAESVTRLVRTNGQAIKLIVNEDDKELRVNYED